MEPYLVNVLTSRFSFVITREGTDMSVGKSYGYIFLHLSTNESILISSFFFFRSVFFLA